MAASELAADVAEPAEVDLAIEAGEEAQEEGLAGRGRSILVVEDQAGERGIAAGAGAVGVDIDTAVDTADDIAADMAAGTVPDTAAAAAAAAADFPEK